MHIQRIPLKPIDISHVNSDFDEAYLEFYRIRHLRPTFTVHVFFNDVCPEEFNKDDDSYATSFSVFGHPVCTGSVGHCSSDVEIRRFDHRPSKHMVHAFRRSPVSLRLKQWIDEGNKELPLSLLAVSHEEWPNKGEKNLLVLDAIQLVTC